MYLHENGLLLDEMIEADLERLLNLKSESWFGTHSISILNLDDQIRWYKTTKPYLLIAWDMWPVGTWKLEFDEPNKRCDAAYNIFLDQRGKGYGKKIVEAGVAFCFEVLDLNRIDIEILENNVASRKCAEHVGFVKEGVKRKSTHKCDQWLDSTVYGLLKEEWTNPITMAD